MQDSLFGNLDDFSEWKKEWIGMPEHKQDSLEPAFQIEVNFLLKDVNGKPEVRFGAVRKILVSFEDVEAIQEFATKLGLSGINCETKACAYIEGPEKFAELLGQSITKQTKSIWYPEAEIGRVFNKRWVGDKGIKLKYPLYILSKGRAESRKTVRNLEEMGVDYHICVEPQEYEEYARVIDHKKIYKLPFSNLGQGGIPARNWIWEDAKSKGFKYHWTVDDNLDGFGRLYNNLKIKVGCGTALRAMEDFVDRYENVAIAGPQYDYFLPRKVKHPAFITNTRIYSCMLLKTDLEYRWRGKYNEDTDLSIRMMKDGWASILFYHFFQYKTPTLQDKGGNTDGIYAESDKRKEFAESLHKQHPDIVKVVWKYDRWHHEVDYSRFKRNKLKRRTDIVIPEECPYRLELKEIE